MNLRFFSLLIAIFTISVASYVVTPLIPIYCIESLEHGGLAWSRADAFSLFGTFLALVYISPCVGGLLGDCIFGRPLIALFGYSLFVFGLLVLKAVSTYDAVFLALIAVAFGIGFIKVSLTSFVGRLPEEIRQKGYEYHYVAGCLGFVLGGLLSNVIFDYFSINGIIFVALGGAFVSICFFFGFSGRRVFSAPQENQVISNASEKSASFAGSLPFFVLLALGVPFFICSNQLVTGMSVFLHQCVDRKVWGWTIPALWFGVIGSTTMIVASPWLRKMWNGVVPSSRGEPLKFSVGCGLSALSFALAAMTAVAGPMAIISGVPLFLCLHALCHIADFHVRPVLFSMATSFAPPRYHTLCTALVYGCIGLGCKLAGTLASCADTIGFSSVFAICSLLSTVCGTIAFIWWKRSSLSLPGTEVAVSDRLTYL